MVDAGDEFIPHCWPSAESQYSRTISLTCMVCSCVAPTIIAIPICCIESPPITLGRQTKRSGCMATTTTHTNVSERNVFPSYHLRVDRVVLAQCTHTHTHTPHVYEHTYAVGSTSIHKHITQPILPRCTRYDALTQAHNEWRRSAEYPSTSMDMDTVHRGEIAGGQQCA